MNSKIHYHIIPEAQVDESERVRTICYQTKTNNAKSHIRMRPEDEQYVYHWLNRLVCDIVNKQFIKPELYRAFTKSDTDFPYGGYKNPNSILSYAAGLCSNRYRNPSEDLTKKHLQYVEQLFVIIRNLYDNMPAQDLGYDLRTGVANELPQQLVFLEV